MTATASHLSYGRKMHQIADLLFMASAVLFSVSLVPTLLNQWRRKESTVPLSTSLTIITGLILVAAAQVLLRLPLATAGTLLGLFGWVGIAWQRVIYTRREESVS